MTLGTGWVCNGWVQFYIGIYWAKSLKIFSETDQPQKAKTSVEASSGRVDYHLFKSWSPGIGWSHNGDPIFTYEFIEYNLQMSSSSKKKKTFEMPRKAVSSVKATLYSVDSNSSKSSGKG